MSQLERSRRAGIGEDRWTSFLEGLEFLPQPRHHVLQPLDVVPPFFPLVYYGPILDVPRAVRILEGVDCLSRVPFGWADASDHECMRVTT